MAGMLNVDTKHPLYALFLPEYEQIDDCIAGERAIKGKGTKYLPAPPAWNQKHYQAYKLRARFMNATARTLKALVGIAMSQPLGIEIEGDYEYLRDDADGRGGSITQLFRDGVAENLAKGRGGILLDNLNVHDGEYEGGVAVTTEAQSVNEVWVLRHFKAKQIINWRVTNGELSLLVLKYEEQVDNDSFEIVMQTIWLELRMMDGKCFGRVWKAPKGIGSVATLPPGAITRGAGETEFIQLLRNGVPLDFIPFAWYGAENNDETPDTPPMADIASLNIGHYQTDADIAEAAFVLQPTLVVSGLTEDWAKKILKGGVSVGADEGILLPREGKAEIVQAKETSASTIRQDRLESQMAKLGAKLTERGTGSRTATQAGDEASTDNSILSQCVGNVEAAINLALSWLDPEIKIEANRRYVDIAVDSQALVAMMNAVQSNMMLIGDFIRWMQQVGLADQSKSIAEIEDELRNQTPTFSQGGLNGDE